MGIFKQKKESEPKQVLGSAPEEDESEAEENYMEELSEPSIEETAEKQIAKPVVYPEDKSKIEIREIPVCMSQAQINNLVIENNIILKQIISNMKD